MGWRALSASSPHPAPANESWLTLHNRRGSKRRHGHRRADAGRVDCGTLTFQSWREDGRMRIAQQLSCPGVPAIGFVTEQGADTLHDGDRARESACSEFVILSGGNAGYADLVN
jgi:hypothetical protein